MEPEACSVCTESYLTSKPCEDGVGADRRPRILTPCAHSFCSTCVWKQCEANANPVCPTCRVPITIVKEQGVAQFPLNFALMQMIDKERGLLQELHEARVIGKLPLLEKQHQPPTAVATCIDCTSNADEYCMQCRSPFCQQHGSSAHQSRALQSHRRVALVDVQSSYRDAVAAFCTEHEYPLMWYCKDCRILCCQECVNASSSAHLTHLARVVNLSDAKQTTAQERQEKCTRLRKVRELTEGEMRRIEQVAATQEQVFKRQKIDILETFDTCRRRLDAQQQVALEMLQGQQNALAQNLDMLFSCFYDAHRQHTHTDNQEETRKMQEPLEYLRSVATFQQELEHSEDHAVEHYIQLTSVHRTPCWTFEPQPILAAMDKLIEVAALKSHSPFQPISAAAATDLQKGCLPWNTSPVKWNKDRFTRFRTSHTVAAPTDAQRTVTFQLTLDDTSKWKLEWSLRQSDKDKTVTTLSLFLFQLSGERNHHHDVEIRLLHPAEEAKHLIRTLQYRWENADNGYGWNAFTTSENIPWYTFVDELLHFTVCIQRTLVDP